MKRNEINTNLVESIGARREVLSSNVPGMSDKSNGIKKNHSSGTVLSRKVEQADPVASEIKAKTSTVLGGSLGISCQCAV